MDNFSNKIYISVTGSESLIPCTTVAGVYFLDVPDSLFKYMKRVHPNNLQDIHYQNNILKYQEYFQYKYTTIENYLGLEKHRRIKQAAQTIAIDLAIRNNVPIKDIVIIQHKNITMSTDLNYAPRNKNLHSNPLFKVAHALSLHYRQNILYKYQTLYPEFKFTNHTGAGLASHYMEILKLGYITPIHNPEALELAARYLIKRFYNLDFFCLDYYRYLARLPIKWFRTIKGSKTNLYDYCISDQEKVDLKDCSRLIKYYYYLEKKNKKIMLLPNKEDYPQEFKKWRETYFDKSVEINYEIKDSVPTIHIIEGGVPL